MFYIVLVEDERPEMGVRVSLSLYSSSMLVLYASHYWLYIQLFTFQLMQHRQSEYLPSRVG